MKTKDSKTTAKSKATTEVAKKETATNNKVKTGTRIDSVVKALKEQNGKSITVAQLIDKSDKLYVKLYNGVSNPKESGDCVKRLVKTLSAMKHEGLLEKGKFPISE